MSHSKDVKKLASKKPSRTIKEKREAKRLKIQEKTAKQTVIKTNQS